LELELANKELESFSYAVSHDLRAPLRHVQGFSNALLEDCAGDLNEAGQAHLERICRAIRRMDQLIEDLLSLSRAAQAPVRKTNVDLSRMARDIVSELRSETPDRNVELAIAEDLAARGDQRLLHVVLTNLLSNAWKFTGKRDNARIEVSRGAPADGETTFCVRDNGAGFDMKYAEKLFSVFQRLHSDRDFPGTGVGLATVQRIIHKHGGRIWAESTPGEGAAFYFTLPPS
jgi:light-regulated signal transduction histidine kinase (bacteriophytochrome)